MVRGANPKGDREDIWYWRQGEYLGNQPDKLDRLRLIAALRDGRDIPGAVLGNPPMTISVRTK